ncbi:MAG: DUF115 domain-containing protein [Planctomycetes bacterium]|nr:DUF115 domain-containing protein [Planctomycetota bacterium]
MEETLRRNIEALRSGPAWMSAPIRDLPAMPTAALSTARSGDPTIAVRAEDGAEVWLHSKYDPRREAAGLAGEGTAGPLDTIVLLGIGLGYPLRAILEKVGPANPVVAIERDPALVRAALSMLPMDDVLVRKNLFIFAGAEPDRVMAVLSSWAGLFLGSGIRLIAHPASARAFAGYYGRMREAIREFVRSGTVLVRTSLYLSRVSFENRLLNLRSYAESPGLRPYRGRFRGYPGVVVAAGPSLDRNVEDLRRIAGKAPIIAVSTGLKILLGRGIRPDFTAIIDYHRLSRRYFEEIPAAARIPLVCDLKANADAIRAYGGPLIFGNDRTINTLLRGACGDKGDIVFGSTVAHAAFSLARYFGCDPIILVGQDLAYTDGQLHAAGSAVYGQSFAEFGRFHTFEMKEWEYYLIHRPNLHRVPAIGGGEVLTCDIFRTYLHEFEKLFAAGRERVIDATEGGARKSGAEPMSLADAARAFATRDLPPDLLRIPEDSPEERAARVRAMYDAVRETRSACRTLDGLYGRALEEMERILERTARGLDADDIVRRIQPIRDELRAHGPLYHALSHLAQADLLLRMKADREIDVEAPAGVERQARQAIRDREYLKGLRNALGFLEECLERSRDEFLSAWPDLAGESVRR